MPVRQTRLYQLRDTCFCDVVVVGIREDEEVYEIAQKRKNKNEL